MMHGQKNIKKFRVFVKMRYNIFKFRNISLSYVQVSVFRQYALLVLTRTKFNGIYDIVRRIIDNDTSVSFSI